MSAMPPASDSTGGSRPSPDRISKRNAFLWASNDASSFTYETVGDTFRCSTGGGFNFLRLIVGLLLGPGLTFWKIVPLFGGPSFFSRGIPMMLFLAVCASIGWNQFLQIFAARRQVTIDVAKRELTLSSTRLRTTRETAIPFDDIEKFAGVSFDVSERWVSRSSSATRKRNTLNVLLRDGSTVLLLSSPWDTPWQQMTQFIQNKSPVPIVFSAEQPAGLPANTPWFSILMLLIGFLGAMIAGFNGVVIYQSAQAKKWPTTQAVVTEARTWEDTHWHRTSMGHEEKALGTQSAMKYTFEVNHHPFTAATISYDDTRCVMITRASPVGSTITIYYDSANPSNAVVDPNVNLRTIVYTIVGAMMLISFCIFVAYNVRSSRRAA